MAEFFIAKNEVPYEKVMAADTLMRAAPEYYGPRFDAIKDLRDADDGTLFKGAGFRRVASFVNIPILMAQRLDSPEVLKDKKTFYAMLDRHPEYLTYQRRNRGRGTARDNLRLPLSALGLDVPGVQWTEREHAVASGDPEEAPEPDPVPGSAEGAHAE